MRTFILAAAIVFVGGTACVSGGDDLTGPGYQQKAADVVGAECLSTDGCPYSDPYTFCARAEGPSGTRPFAPNVCTTTCQTHQECGCAVGVDNESIATARACKVACVTAEGEKIGYCVRVCSQPSDCAARAKCTSLGGVGYSGCLAP